MFNHMPLDEPNISEAGRYSIPYSNPFFCRSVYDVSFQLNGSTTMLWCTDDQKEVYLILMCLRLIS